MARIVKASEIFKLSQVEFCIQNREYQSEDRDPKDKCKFCIHSSLCDNTIKQIKLIMLAEDRKEDEN